MICVGRRDVSFSRPFARLSTGPQNCEARRHLLNQLRLSRNSMATLIIERSSLAPKAAAAVYETSRHTGRNRRGISEVANSALPMEEGRKVPSGRIFPWFES